MSPDLFTGTYRVTFSPDAVDPAGCLRAAPGVLLVELIEEAHDHDHDLRAVAGVVRCIGCGWTPSDAELAEIDRQEAPTKRRYRFEWIGSARVYCEVGAAASDPTLTVVDEHFATAATPNLNPTIYAPLRGYVERDLEPDEVDGYFDDLLDVDFLGGTLTVQPTEWYGSWEFESATLVLVTSEKLEAIR